MKISLAWLREWVEIDLSPEDLAEALSNAGFEVESIEYQDQYLKKIVVAEILSADPHPNADKLRITRAGIGAGEELQIVTAASNVGVGDKVPLALIGARLAEDFEIKKAKLRGVDSFGMYCSEKELGLARESSGVMILPPETTVGLEIADYLDKRDIVLEVTSTANRGDCLSYTGIAREVAAITNKPLKKSLSGLGSTPVRASSVRLENKVPDECRTYIGRIMGSVQVAESPAWLKKKLLSSGMKPVNNVVDVTNYVMLEMGQPLHAFDLAEIKNGSLLVRNAAEGEPIRTLDGVERTLSSKDTIIADPEGPLAIAGLMGGKRGEVGPGTHSILMEAAYFLPASVRRASKRHNLRTEASHRFERGVDPEGVGKAIELASYWIAELCNGKVTSSDATSQTGLLEPLRIDLRIGRVNRVLGTSLSLSTVQEVLTRLQFKTKAKDDFLTVEVPSFRREDVTREADLIEEVSRIYGYRNIAATLPTGWGASRQPITHSFKETIREKLASSGLWDVITYSMVSASLYAKVLPGDSPEKLIPVVNPLTEDYAYLRDSLVPSLLEVAQRNTSRQENNLSLFEVGKVFRKGERDHGEALRVCGLLSGELLSTWSQKTIHADFFAAKGIIDDLFGFLGVRQVSYLVLDQDHRFHPGRSAKIQVGGEILGAVGELDPRIAQRFDLMQKVYLFDLDFDLLLKHSSSAKKYQPLPQYPAISRDLAFLVGSSLTQGVLESSIRKHGGALLKSVRLFDCYQGEPVPSGYKSMAYSLTFLSPEKTLTEEEVNPVLKNITAALEKDFGIQLRSQ